MKLFRSPAFLAAVAMSVIVAMYFAFAAQLAVSFLQSSSPVGVALGAALILLPLIGMWYLAQEWRLGLAVQRMADDLDAAERLPVHDGARTPQGKLTDEAAQELFASVSQLTRDNPQDWAAWFHVAYAYDANRDRRMARRSLRYAAALYRDERHARRG